MSGSRIVYTCIFNGRDYLREPKCPPHELEGIDFVCFTDDHSLESKTWQLVKLNEKPDDPHLLAKRFKMFPHELFPHAESTIWIDGLFTLQRLNGAFDLESQLAVRRHPKRRCVYQEIVRCRRRNRDTRENLMRVQVRLEREQFPVNYGLWMGGVLFRRNTDEVKQFNERWWSEITEYSIRDQLTLPYVLRETGIEFFELPGSMPLLHWGMHRTRPR